jgi:PleD family two-component response regulator
MNTPTIPSLSETRSSVVLVVTDEERLQRKVRSLQHRQQTEYPASDASAEALQLCLSPDEVLDALRAVMQASSVNPPLVFVDLHAATFDGYELCCQIKEEFPNVQTIGSSLGVDVAVVQKSKLFKVDVLLQRYKFEELLRKVAAVVRE